MLRWTLTTVCMLLATWPGQDQPGVSKQTATSQPTTQPAAAPTRRPVQAEILKKLIQEQQRRAPIEPVDPGGPRGATIARSARQEDPEGNPLLVDGTVVVERPARLVYEDGRPKLVLTLEGSSRQRSMELLRNQLLAAMEHESTAGFSEFVITGEVTRYQGENYILLRKLLRRVDNGNLGP